MKQPELSPCYILYTERNGYVRNKVVYWKGFQRNLMRFFCQFRSDFQKKIYLVSDFCTWYTMCSIIFCIYVGLCVCVFVSMSVSVYLSMFVCLPVSVCQSKCVCQCMCMCVCLSIFVCLSVSVSLCQSVCVCQCVSVCVCVHVCVCRLQESNKCKWKGPELDGAW